MQGGGGNDLSYLNHIIIAHYNASYGCRKCLKQAFMSSSALHNHKKVCLGFITKKPAIGSDSKPSSGRGGDGSHGGSGRATPKKKDSKAPTADSQGSSALPASQTPACHSGQEMSHHHKSHKDSKDSSGDKKKRRRIQAPPGRAPATRHTRMAAVARLMSAPSTAVSPVSLYLVNKIFHCKTHVSVMI